MCCWGVDAGFDAQCAGDIGLEPPPMQMTYGVRGHGGHFSFLTPVAQMPLVTLMQVNSVDGPTGLHGS